MKKIILLLLLFWLTGTKTVWADISISPFYVLFDASSHKRTDLVRFTNAGTQVNRYRIRLVNYRQLQDGTYQEITKPLKNMPFAAPYLNYAPHETTLQPNQSQIVRIQRKAMAAAPDGEYVSHLMIEEMPEAQNSVSQTGTLSSNELKIDIKALYRITIPIIIDKGKLTDVGKLGAARILQMNEGDFVSIDVERTGTQSFWGTLQVMEKGVEIGRVNTFKIFLSTSKRSIDVPLDKKTSGPVKIILRNARTDEIVDEKTL